MQLWARLWHSPKKWSSGLCTMLKLRAHVKLTLSQSLFLSSRSQHYSIHWGYQCLVWWSCELISADYCLTQSTEMIFWTVHHVEVESTCQADSVSHCPCVVVVSTTAFVQLWAHLCSLWLHTVCRNDVVGCAPCWSWEHMSSWQCLSHCPCVAVVSTTAFNGDSSVMYAQLWAHLCRLWLDTVRRNDLLGCTPCWSWEHMSSWQCLIHCSCPAVVSTTAFVQLWAHLCRLLLDTVHRNDLLDCTSTSSCEYMSSWQCASHCSCLAVVSTTACIGDITVEYSCELISADYRLTQSAEKIFWTVHHVLVIVFV